VLEFTLFSLKGGLKGKGEPASRYLYQVVAKNDPNMPNLNQKQFLFSTALMLHFF
jgi:hypothetical protein